MSTADTGLARQRTTLSWTRTALAVGLNGVLVLVRHPRAFPLGLSLALAAGSLALAGLCLLAGWSRARALRVAAPTGPSPALVGALGVTAGALAVATTVVIIWAPR